MNIHFNAQERIDLDDIIKVYFLMSMETMLFGQLQLDHRVVDPMWKAYGE